MRTVIIAVLLAACGSKGSKPASKDGGAAVAAAKDAGAPDARPVEPDVPQYAGDPFADPAVAPGTLRVTLTRGAALAPAAGVTLHVVAIDTAGVTTDATYTTDVSGAFEVVGLRRDGAVAYHVLGELDGDRLESGPVTLREQGVRVELSARAPGDPAPPLVGFQELERPVPAGEVWVTVGGLPDAAGLTLVEVATSASMAPTSVAQARVGPSAQFTGLTPGAVYVAQLRHSSGLHVSRPMLAMDGPGAGRALMAMAVPMVRCQTSLRRDRDGLGGWTRCEIWQSGGMPRALANPLVLPLPGGATAHDLQDPVGPAKLVAGALTWIGPVPPATTTVAVSYALPVVGGATTVAVVSPQGMAELAFMIEAGTTSEVSGVTGGQHRAPDFNAGDEHHFVRAEYTRAGDRLAFMITGIQPTTPCELLGVARWTADGNPAPAPDIEAEASDGTRVKLSSLRGQPVVLNLFASWTPPSAQELPSLIALSRVIEPLGARLVVVASDQTWDAVTQVIDPTSGIDVWLDPPRGGEYVLGDIAHAFGTTMLPETYLIDAEGLVRSWVVNARDWTSPDALACIQTLKTPWTGTVTQRPPPHVPATNLLGGTIQLATNVAVPAGGVLFISARNKASPQVLAGIRVEHPTFPQSFRMTDAELFSIDHPLRGEVEVTARVDRDGDITTRQAGDVFGTAFGPAGSSNVQITIDQLVP